MTLNEYFQYQHALDNNPGLYIENVTERMSITVGWPNITSMTDFTDRRLQVARNRRRTISDEPPYTIMFPSVVTHGIGFYVDGFQNVHELKEDYFQMYGCQEAIRRNLDSHRGVFISWLAGSFEVLPINDQEMRHWARTHNSWG